MTPDTQRVFTLAEVERLERRIGDAAKYIEILERDNAELRAALEEIGSHRPMTSDSIRDVAGMAFTMSDTARKALAELG